MSVHLTKTNSAYFTRIASVFGYNANYTVTFWIKIDDLAQSQNFFFVRDTGDNNYDGCWDAATSGVQNVDSRLAGQTEKNANSGAFTISSGAWYFMALRRTSVTALSLFVDTQDRVSLTTDDVTARTAANKFGINVDHYIDSSQANALYAQVRIWETDLSDGELALEKASSVVVHTDALWANYPMTNASTAIEDISGNDRDLTANGTPTDGNDDPPGQSGATGGLMWL